ncbi:MAG: alpha,alpha-trehalase TreF [Bacteroidota bacterium]
MRAYFLILIVASILVSCQQTPTSTPETTVSEETSLRMLSPVERYGDLYVDVMMAEIFSDDKTFADAIPNFDTQTIIDSYEKEKAAPDFNLQDFVDHNFTLPTARSSGFETDFSRSIDEHVNALWPVLTRQPDEQDPGTLVPLPEPYIVPGGRFGEIYYWDSYFTMLGLEVSGKTDMIENMIDNFSYLIDTIGFIPNGNRTYFLTRSQPPFYASMVQLLQEAKPSEPILGKYLPSLEKEYAFWMDGEASLSNEQHAVNHVVQLPGGEIMNRYFDRSQDPRAEMYQDDIELAETSGRTGAELFADLRSACESGWDFSSRWLEDPMDLSTIRSTKIIPVDLNALLYNLEQTLATAYANTDNAEQAEAFLQRAAKRKAAIQKYCWDAERGFFMDYDFEKGQVTSVPSLAGLFPLYFGVANPEQIGLVAEVVERDFLHFGGVVSTLERTGQQWDSPNGWAPLQYITIEGLHRNGETELAQEIAQRWISLNNKVYQSTGKMVEKYNVVDEGLEAGGGEYPLQDGFGWTNGVLLRLMQDFEE